MMVGACKSCGRIVLKFCLNPDCLESKKAIKKQKSKAKKAPKKQIKRVKASTSGEIHHLVGVQRSGQPKLLNFLGYKTGRGTETSDRRNTLDDIYRLKLSSIEDATNAEYIAEFSLPETQARAERMMKELRERTGPHLQQKFPEATTQRKEDGRWFKEKYLPSHPSPSSPLSPSSPPSPPSLLSNTPKVSTSKPRNPDWTEEECAALVKDYFSIYDAELREESPNKAAHNHNLQKKIGRTRGSIEMKHRNVSAVLQELEKPIILGYKPAEHKQQLLVEVVKAELASRKEAEQTKVAVKKKGKCRVCDKSLNNPKATVHTGCKDKGGEKGKKLGVAVKATDEKEKKAKKSEADFNRRHAADIARGRAVLDRIRKERNDQD